MDPLVVETGDGGDQNVSEAVLDQTVVSDDVVEENFDEKPPGFEGLGEFKKDNLVLERVPESVLEEIVVEKPPGFEEISVNDVEFKKNLVGDEALVENPLGFEEKVTDDVELKHDLGVEETLVEKPLGFEAICLDGVEINDGYEPCTDESTRGSSSNSVDLDDVEEAPDGVDSGMYRDAQSPTAADDWNELGSANPGYRYAPNQLAWENPYCGRRENELGSASPVNRYAPNQLAWENPYCGQQWENPYCGQRYGPSWPRWGDPYWRSRQSSWSYSSQIWNKDDNEENNSSLTRSDLGDVTPDMVGAGLYNLGNTCFLNAILQCFTHTVPLIEGLRSYNHPKPCERDSNCFCVFCALLQHIELAISGKEKRLSPLKIVENLNQLSSDFRRYQQEDAHELLQSLLDKLDCCTGNSDQSLVQQLFGGRLVSKLKCCNCGHCSDTFEPLIDLSLEIEDVSSLPSALESFTKVEKIEDEEPQFECESCKEKVTVEKQLMVDHAPSIAAFHLKRFKNDGSRVEKIDKHVEFPLELDLEPFTSGGHNDNAGLSYNLYAIVVHSGFSPTSGHYISFIRSAPNAWFRLDDSQVTRVSEAHVLSRDAYILLYAKKGTPWFSSFMETQKPPVECKESSPSPVSVLESAKSCEPSSSIVEANLTGEVNEEDRREAMEICGMSSNSAKSDSRTGKKLFSSNIGGEKLGITRDTFKSVFEGKRVSESSPAMETANHSDGHEEDRRDAEGISRASLPARVDDSNHLKDGELVRKTKFISSISRRSSSPPGIQKPLFNDCAEDATKVEKGTAPSAASRGKLRKSADIINLSTFSEKPDVSPKEDLMTEKVLPSKRQLGNDKERKEACRFVKNMAGSKRRSQLMQYVKCSPETSSSKKKAKVNESTPRRKDGPTNALLNPNLAY